MRRSLVAAAACCAVALGALAPSAVAGDVERVCAMGATWSLTSTSATVNYPTHSCYGVAVSAGLDGVVPEWSASGEWRTYAPASVTYSYAPIVGNCLGTLSLETPSRSYKGVVKNDGNHHTTVTVVMTPKTAPATKIVAQYVGVLQTPCTSSFGTTVVSSSSDSIP